MCQGSPHDTNSFRVQLLKDLWVQYRDWVFEPISYTSADELVQGLDVLVKRAQARSAELVARKAEKMRVERMKDLLNEAGLIK